MPGCEVTLEQILKAREERAEKQKSLIAAYGLPLISFTVNMPGAGKNTERSRRIFFEGRGVLLNRLKERGTLPVYQETRDLPTGPEAFVMVDMDVRAVKRLMLEIEESHPLGRLWDFDVIGRDGLSISREALGFTKRKCLLCREDAHACARSRAHSPEELLEKIRSMTNAYFDRNKMPEGSGGSCRAE